MNKVKNGFPKTNDFRITRIYDKPDKDNFYFLFWKFRNNLFQYRWLHLPLEDNLPIEHLLCFYKDPNWIDSHQKMEAEISMIFNG